MTPASWIIREKSNGNVVMETFSAKIVAALNTAKYEAVPVQDYLGSINGRHKPAQSASAAMPERKAS